MYACYILYSFSKVLLVCYRIVFSSPNHTVKLHNSIENQWVVHAECIFVLLHANSAISLHYVNFIVAFCTSTGLIVRFKEQSYICLILFQIK